MWLGVGRLFWKVRKGFLEEGLVNRVSNEKREPSMSRSEGKDF